MTADPYTPDETELRDCYAASLHEHAGEDYATAKADAERGIVKIKADALREAAELIEVAPDVHPYDVCSTERACEQRAEAWLRDRANRIEEEA